MIVFPSEQTPARPSLELKSMKFGALLAGDLFRASLDGQLARKRYRKTSATRAEPILEHGLSEERIIVPDEWDVWKEMPAPISAEEMARREKVRSITAMDRSQWLREWIPAPRGRTVGWGLSIKFARESSIREDAQLQVPDLMMMGAQPSRWIRCRVLLRRGRGMWIWDYWKVKPGASWTP